MFFLTSWFANGQSTFIYDQQSINLIEGSVGLGAQPVGQSFTPSFSSVGFIMLNLADGVPGGGGGGTPSVNLRANSITGTILGSTTPVTLPSHFFGVTNFFFTTPITVVPNVTYYFQLVSGGGGFCSYVTDGYAGGTAISQGAAKNYDLWFREGVVVPEPSSALLVLLGGGVLFYARRKKNFNQ